jgi:lambda family phage portal protein
MAATDPPLLDRAISYVSPGWGLKRAAARKGLEAYYYEAATPSRNRKSRRERAASPVITQMSAQALRDQARWMDRNHDIGRGILRTLVNNTVGPQGIGIEPQPRKRNGEIHTKYARALLAAHREWRFRPEVTRRLGYGGLQRLQARTWFRDGESLHRVLIGSVPGLKHAGRMPLSLQLLEPDFLPLEYDDDRLNVRQGIELDRWGRARAYHFYEKHPHDQVTMTVSPRDLLRVPAEHVRHLFIADRVGQIRGLSEFASVLTRLDDVKDYEESERIAAKVAAAITGVITRGDPATYDPKFAPRDEQGNPLPRDLQMSPGMIIDSLTMGESVSLLDPKRPNPNVITFRSGQLRAVAAGIGASASSITRSYDGTFSAQRQELVEQWVNYAVLTDEFVCQEVDPDWRTFVRIADLSGVVPIPRDVVPETADDALFIGEEMPWIDPQREAAAWEVLVKAGFAAEVEAIRSRGRNPADVMEQVLAWRAQAKDKGLVFSSDAAHEQRAAARAREPATSE